MNVTETELLQQVQSALFESSDPAGAMSVAELCEETDMTPPAIRLRLKRLIAQGDVEVVKVPRTNIVGTVARQYCYRMVTPKETHEDK
jgi:predicted ArsR family transcriptional regulator|tara:strand:- start:2307 stop:2570 length:264 start_codon:yes stop_codon:yes gene_type:complete